MPKPQPFDHDARETANRLFATATMILEDANAVALAGQHSKLRAAACIKHARELKQIAADLVALADAALVISGNAGRHPRHMDSKTPLLSS